jgi:hypothetical protein
MSEHLTIEGMYEPVEGPNRRVYLPVQVPAGAVRLSVDASGLEVHRGPREQHAITLGAFDTRGNQFLTTGFRGWTSTKNQFEISPEKATPGFLRGAPSRCRSRSPSASTSIRTVLPNRLARCRTRRASYRRT